MDNPYRNMSEVDQLNWFGRRLQLGTAKLPKRMKVCVQIISAQAATVIRHGTRLTAPVFMLPGFDLFEPIVVWPWWRRALWRIGIRLLPQPDRDGCMVLDVAVRRKSG